MPGSWMPWQAAYEINPPQSSSPAAVRQPFPTIPNTPHITHHTPPHAAQRPGAHDPCPVQHSLFLSFNFVLTSSCAISSRPP